MMGLTPALRKDFIARQRKDMYERWFEPPHDKTNKMACAPSEDSVQPLYGIVFRNIIIISDFYAM